MRHKGIIIGGILRYRRDSQSKPNNRNLGFGLKRLIGSGICFLIPIILVMLSLAPIVQATTYEDSIKEGLSYLDEGDFENAENSFKEAINLDPDHPSGHLGLGKSYYYQCLFEKAITELKKAIDLNPKDKKDLVEAYEYLAFTYIGLNDFDKAQEAFKNSLQIDPALQLDPTYHPPKIIKLFEQVREKIVSSLAIISTPDKAQVYLDGQLKGKTPLELDAILSGSHQVKLIKDGYEEWNEEITLKPREMGKVIVTLKSKRIEIAIPKGAIRVKSSPDKAMVYLDGEEKGTTPLTIEEVLIGQHHLKVSLRGYDDWQKLIEVHSDKTNLLDIPLSLSEEEPEPILTIISKPAEAEVYIGGNFKGMTPLIIRDLETGYYDIRISKKGYKSWISKLFMPSALSREVEITLERAQGTLFVTSSPYGANVYLNEELKGKTPLTIPNIPIAQYKLRLSKEGYQEYEDIVTVEEQQRVEVEITLSEALGWLSINSIPASAEIYINDEDRGKTPLSLTSFPPGVYRIKLIKSGYDTWKEVVTIKANDIIRIQASLEAHFGKLMITSTPSSALVYLDGEIEGTTPLILESIPTGDYTLELAKDGYQTWKKRTRVIANRDNEVKVQLIPETGGLEISSEPGKAQVYIGGELQGETPYTISDLPVGKYKIRVSKNGYSSWRQTVDIRAGQVAQLRAELAKTTSSLTIKSTPPGAKIYIDGQLQGLTDLIISSFAPGSYEIRLVKEGYKEWKRTAVILSAQDQEIDAILEKK